MNVEQVMCKTVRSCSVNDSLDRAASIMWDLDCGCVPVVEAGNGGGHVIGMITDRDICMSAYSSGKNLKELRVEQAMARDICACRPYDSIAEAEEQMRRAQVRRLVVIDGSGQLQGLVSLADLVRAVTPKQGRKKQEISELEISGTLATICQPRAAAGAM
jgi:CBS domain-containing protein